MNSILEHIGAATIIFNGEAVVTACNGISEELLDLQTGKLVGSSLAELDLQIVDSNGKPEQNDAFPLNRVAKGQKTASGFDFGLTLPVTGRTEWFRATLQPNYAINGDLSFVVLTFLKITELVVDKITNSQIYLAKSEWETTVDALQDIVLIQDLDMRIVRANKMAHEVFGYALGELKGRKCHEVFHDRKTPCKECPALRVGKDNSSKSGLVHSAKLDKTFNLSAFPISDQEGRIRQFVHVARDVTESLRTESEKNRLMAAIEQVSESVVISNSKGEIQYVNPTFEVTTGYSRAEAIGKKLNILKSGKHDEAFYQSMWKTLLSKNVWRGRLTNRRKNGTLFKEDATISPVLDDSGKIVNYVALKRDVTREELLEQRLQQGMKMEALGTLAGGIAHDFNNILAAMIGYGEIAKDRLPKEHPARKDLEQVISSGDRAVDLVKQILTFSRKESYGQFRVFKLQYVIQEVVKLLRPPLPPTIDLRCEVDDSCHSVFADPSQLYQVLMNLCTNARQSIGDRHGCITIRLSEMTVVDQHVGGGTSEEPKTILDLEVSDTGCGIADEVLDKIFDPFFTTKKKEHGTGLGLAVVHGIIKKHKGEIHITSKLGVGTTVHVYLTADGRAVDARELEDSARGGGHERIMVVDDEPPVANMLRKMLQKAGYQVTTFYDSMAAVEHFRMDPNCCDLVITDLLMPDLTGAELAREYIALRSDIPIIIFTGHGENFDRKRAKKLGVKELLLKPVKKEKLYQVIRKVLEHGENINH